MGIPSLILNEVEAASTSHQTALSLTHVPVALPGILTIIPTGIPSIQQTPLIWHYRDLDIKLDNRFPYAGDDTTNSIVDFEVWSKVVKFFSDKNTMYNQNLMVKATYKDVG